MLVGTQSALQCGVSGLYWLLLKQYIVISSPSQFDYLRWQDLHVGPVFSMNAGTMKIRVNSFWGAFLFLLGKVTLDPTGRILIISVRVSRPQYRVADIFARSTSCSYLKGNFDFL